MMILNTLYSNLNNESFKKKFRAGNMAQWYSIYLGQQGPGSIPGTENNKNKVLMLL